MNFRWLHSAVWLVGILTVQKTGREKFTIKHNEKQTWNTFFFFFFCYLLSVLHRVTFSPLRKQCKIIVAAVCSLMFMLCSLCVSMVIWSSACLTMSLAGSGLEMSSCLFEQSVLRNSKKSSFISNIHLNTQPVYALKLKLKLSWYWKGNLCTPSIKWILFIIFFMLPPLCYFFSEVKHRCVKHSSSCSACLPIA